jgi:hypothetical protein
MYRTRTSPWKRTWKQHPRRWVPCPYTCRIWIPLQDQPVGVMRVNLPGHDVGCRCRCHKDANRHRVTPVRIPFTLTWARRTPESTQPGPAPPSRGRTPRPPRSDLRRLWMQAQRLAASHMRAIRQSERQTSCLSGRRVKIAQLRVCTFAQEVHNTAKVPVRCQ